MSTPRTMRPWFRVTNGNELVNGIKAHCWFYLGTGPKDRPKHWGFIQSMQLRTLIGFMERGNLYVARKIKQEDKHGN